MRRGRVVPGVDAVMPAGCERARTSASLALDCELSELGRARLRAHLRDCPACSTFTAELREVTHELRTAPLPAPSRPLVPARRRSRLPVVLVLVAVVAAAAAGGLAGSLRSHDAPPRVTATGLRLEALFPQPPQPRPGSRLPLQTAV